MRQITKSHAMMPMPTDAETVWSGVVGDQLKKIIVNKAGVIVAKVKAALRT